MVSNKGRISITEYIEELSSFYIFLLYIPHNPQWKLIHYQVSHFLKYFILEDFNI